MANLSLQGQLRMFSVLIKYTDLTNKLKVDFHKASFIKTFQKKKKKIRDDIQIRKNEINRETFIIKGNR